MRLPLLWLTCGAGGALAQRASESFDFGWRFVKGEQPGYVKPPATQCTSADFPFKMDGIQCMGLTEIGGVNGTEECQAACCRQDYCQVWQWGDDGTCWIGMMSDCYPSAGWKSSGRHTEPQPFKPEVPPTQPCPQSPACANFDDSQWRQLDIPHDFVIEGTFDEKGDRGHGYLPFNLSWYRKTFTVPASWKSQPIYIDFDGVYRASDYWLNGVWLGHHESGYTPFRHYIHNVSGAPLNYGGSNVIAVRVDALSMQEGWFYEGGGIYRHTSLNTMPQVSIVPWGVYAPAVVTGAISSPKGGDDMQTTDEAVVNVFTDIASEAAGKSSYTLATAVLDESGHVVGSAQSTGDLAAGGWARVKHVITLTGEVKLWNTAVPHLYTVQSKLAVGSTSDEVLTTIGIRSAIFDANRGFVLNGIPTKIKGLSMHQDLSGCGTAMPDRANEFRLLAVKNVLGGNGWRTAHNPVNRELLDMADRNGMLVWAENRNLHRQIIALQRGRAAIRHRSAAILGADGEVVVPAHEGPDTPFPFWPYPDPLYLEEAQTMVLRDRNHPSIIIWSICNEGGCLQKDPLGGLVGAAFKAVMYDADQSRPITANSEDDDADTLTKVMDFASFSYNYGEYDDFHRKYPWKPVCGGESASCVATRGYYLPNGQIPGLVNADSSSCVVVSWQTAGARPWVVGNFAWTGIDYLGEPTPLGWPTISSQFGIIDHAGFPKDTAGYYAAWWKNDTSMVRTLPSNWNSPVPEGTAINVVVFANAASVQLFVNGVSHGNQSVPFLGVVTFPNVVFQPGSLSAQSYDAVGRVLGTHTVETTGPVAQIVLSVDAPASGAIYADGQDVALVRVAMVDLQGRIVPDANNRLCMKVTGLGTIYGVGNGNPADHDPQKPLASASVVCRNAFNGFARVIVQSIRNQPGIIALSVAADGLPSSVIQIQSAGSPSVGQEVETFV